MLKRILNIPGAISNRFNKDHVGTYSSQATFFMLLSIFPLAMLCLTMVKYTPVTKAELQNVLGDFVPPYFKGTLIHLINEVYKTASGAVLSITAIGTLWAASKGVMAILLGLNEIYHHNQDRNWFFLRFMSIIYTILFIIVFVLVLIFLVFGGTIVDLVIKHLPALKMLAITTLSWTSIVSFFILTVFFLLVYAIVRSKIFGVIDNVPGAFFASAGWIIFSYVFSFYIEKFAGKTATYGSMTTIVLAMLWVYVLMYILFIGAEINVVCKKMLILSRIRRARKKKQIINTSEQSIPAINKKEDFVATAEISVNKSVNSKTKKSIKHSQNTEDLSRSLNYLNTESDHTDEVEKVNQELNELKKKKQLK